MEEIVATGVIASQLLIEGVLEFLLVEDFVESNQYLFEVEVVVGLEVLEAYRVGQCKSAEVGLLEIDSDDSV